MPGMFTGDRMVRLEVMGNGQSLTSRTTHYTLTVPYSSLSRTIQTLGRTGGKIVGVQVSDVKAVAAQPQANAANKIPDKKPTQTKKGKKK
jgi:CpcD/allophycocyanin linker domain